ncbi:hypothetical protein [Paracoccus litorisediminis]|jgi:hypothetical protein|uniref:hypothetical protein n=1 Tax=Paracoccus litorisediminis TaxID=2006130 RepID=UPI001478E5FD|nr:hypothetical protein [Paracoccus litorisediminis]
MKSPRLLASCMGVLLVLPQHAWSESLRPIRLSCETQGPAAIRLCDAVRDELARRGFSDQPDAEFQLILKASDSDQHGLRARIGVVDGGPMREGQEAELSIMDHASIPESALRSFAASLLDHTPL